MPKTELAGPVAYGLVQSLDKNTTNRAINLRDLYELGAEYSGYSHDFDAIFEADRDYIEAELARLAREEVYKKFSFAWLPDNPFGKYLGANTQREAVQLPSPTTIESIEKMLQENPDVSTIVLGIYPNGVSRYQKILEHLRRHHPKINVVVGAGGAQYPEVGKSADHVLIGNQLFAMQRLLGEPVALPNQVTIVPSSVTNTFYGNTKSSDYPILMTSYGCPYGCDFCPSTAEHGHHFHKPHSAPEIIEAIHAARNLVSPDESRISMTIGDPQALGDIKTWKQVFRECRDLGFIVELTTTTSSKILQQYSLDELTTGDLCLTCVNIGVESMISPYPKNQGVDLKQEISRYQAAGIRVAATFIVGHEWHDNKSLWQDVELIRELDPAVYIVSNLLVEPGTPQTEALRQSGDLFDVPPEFATAFGFQSTKHPHFKPGFSEMTPIVLEIEDRLTYNKSIFEKDIDIFLARQNPSIRHLQAALLAEFRSIDEQNLPEAERSKMRSIAYYKSVYQQPGLFHPYLMWTV